MRDIVRNFPFRDLCHEEDGQNWIWDMQTLDIHVINYGKY